MAERRNVDNGRRRHEALVTSGVRLSTRDLRRIESVAARYPAPRPRRSALVREAVRIGIGVLERIHGTRGAAPQENPL